MIYAFLYAHICPFVTLNMIMNLTCQLENINHINYYSGFVMHMTHICLRKVCTELLHIELLSLDMSGVQLSVIKD